MIFYITSPTYKEIISSTIKEQEQLILAGGEESEDIMLYSFVKTNSATLLSGIDILVVDLSACCDIDEKIIDALEMLKMTNDDVRIIILATYRHPGDALLTKCFQMAIYDIICTDDFLQIKEELKISLLKGKQYKDALQFKEVSNEQIVVKTEIKQMVNKVMIGVVGSDRRMGVTHNVIVLTNFLRKKGYMVALAECNQHKAYAAICENLNCQMQEGFFMLNGVDIYPEVNETLLGIILGKSYNFIVCDYGDFASCDRVNFNKSEIRIIITGAKAWEIAQVNKIFEEVANITTLEGYHYCFNFVPEVYKPDVLAGMGTLKNVHFLKYTENPYMATSFSDAEEILKDYLPSVPITFEKKSIFSFGKRERKKDE